MITVIHYFQSVDAAATGKEGAEEYEGFLTPTRTILTTCKASKWCPTFIKLLKAQPRQHLRLKLFYFQGYILIFQY